EPKPSRSSYARKVYLIGDNDAEVNGICEFREVLDQRKFLVLGWLHLHSDTLHFSIEGYTKVTFRREHHMAESNNSNPTTGRRAASVITGSALALSTVAFGAPAAFADGDQKPEETAQPAEVDRDTQHDEQQP